MNISPLSEDLRTKLSGLITFLNQKRIIVAFSGGIDSTVLAYLSKDYAEESLLLTATSVLFSQEELSESKKFSKRFNIEHLIIDLQILDNEEFVKNQPNRCYVCKRQLFSEFLKIKEDRGYEIIIEGSNVSELDEHRPGLNAIRELGISTPYLEYNINKKEIRQLCQYFNLESCDKPANACYASRIAYNLKIDRKTIKRIRKAEQFLKKTFDLTQVRVRHHQQNLARIEFLPGDLIRIINQKNIESITSYLNQLGFEYVTMDLTGYISGSMNRTI